MKPTFLFSILFIIIALSGCYEKPDYHKNILFQNNSQDTIFFVVQEMENNGDTLLKKESKPGYYPIYPVKNETLPYHTMVGYSNFCIEYTFRDRSRKYLMFTTFDDGIIRNTKWDTIQKYDLVKKRYLIDLGMLEENDFTLSFP